MLKKPITMEYECEPRLLTQRRFLPYFITQFFGAFNDNIFKNVLLIFIVFAGPGVLPVSPGLFVNLAAGLFILPFFLFSATAGEIAEKFDKDWYIRKVKLLEIGIMCMGAVAFITESYSVLLLLLFLMGTQSAFFGPVKYALLPQHLKSEELVSGNALVESGTFMAILFGTLGAGIIASSADAKHVAAASVVTFAVIGYAASTFIPKSPATKPDSPLRWAPIAQTKKTLAIGKQDRTSYQAIIAISWFWFLGAAYLTQFPHFTKVHLHGHAAAISFLLTLFSVGIAFGSYLCDKLSNNRVEIGLAPLGGVLVSLFGILFATSVPENLPYFMNFRDFISHRDLWPLFTYLVCLGASGGLFIVPLYTILQQRAPKGSCCQIIAANNIYNALFMVGSAVLGIVCLGTLKMSIPQLFLLIAILNLFMAAYLVLQAPIYVVRLLVWVLTHTMYRVKHVNLHNIPKEGGALLVCNHVSYMDALLLSAVCPRLIRFVMEEDYANFRPIRGFLNKAGVIPIDGTNRKSVMRAFKEVEHALAEGHLVCIFPEGRLTGDGEIQEFMRGIDIILRRTPVPVIPLALKGMWGSYFSRHKGKACKGLPNRFRSKLEIEASEAVPAGDASCQNLKKKVVELRGCYR